MRSTKRLPAPVTETWDWQLRGACRRQPSERFFHPEQERGAVRYERIRQAKHICAQCPVLAQCREHALRVEEPYGIWGGLDESERRELVLRKRRKTPALTRR
jgi:WhiB family redox-sensing transcriptional regulator